MAVWRLLPAMMSTAALLALLCLATIASAATTPPDAAAFTIQDVVRTFDLVKPYARMAASIVAEVTSPTPQSVFVLAFPTELYDALALLDVRLKNVDMPLGQQLTYAPIMDPAGVPDVTFIEVQLDKEVPQGEVLNLQLKTAFVHTYRPVPKEIRQAEQQSIIWEDSRFILSPYTVTKQRTKIKFPDRGVAAYSRRGDDPLVDGTVVTYGPYNSTNPLTIDPIKVRYEFNFPLLTASGFEREIWVSHIGSNVATEEHYDLTNDASKLANTFSRLRWQASMMAKERTVALQSLGMHLRPGVRDVYFTDEIGNVSTSAFRDDARDPQLEIRPRYPIFGGWNYTFTIGWNHDLARYVRAVSDKEDTYIIKVPFLEGPDALVYDKADVSVVLPEGARVLNAYSTFAGATKEEFLLRSQLDTVGRTVVKFSASKMTDEHRRSSDIFVTYEYTRESELRKPLVVAAAVAALFAGVMILGRLDVNISK
ncbi:Ribophorin I [Limtongia smithiae]|uniref:Ribophorin I n=1 Tax=Limtongia smithiae TaxID=1125753 RepID=UPI0034CE4977